MPDLVPVEDNPFHVKLVPTDEQPDFADSLQGNFGTASQQLLNQEAQRRGVVGNVLQHFTLPGRIAQGVKPETPGVMTEADAFRLNKQNNEALDWAHGQALNTIGTGMPMAERMALGTGGGGIKAYHGTINELSGPLEAKQPALGMKALYASTDPSHANVFAQRTYGDIAGHVTPIDVEGSIASRKYVMSLYDAGLPTEKIAERLQKEGYAGFYEDAEHKGLGIFDPSKSVSYPYLNSPTKGVRAYHGSPHDFDKFDVGKIGTGEGNQVYGHGLYFTERPEIAKQYRDALAGVNTKWMEGDRTLSGAEQNAAEILNRVGGDKHQALMHVKYGLRPGRLTDHEYLNQTEAAINRLDPSKVKVVQDPGRMYEVNINADPEHFLDWDKPLSEQHPKVQEALTPVTSQLQDEYNRAAGMMRNAKSQNVGELTGHDLIDRILGGNEKASAQLREAGIPGIKYLDQGSRNTNQFRVSTEYRPEGDQYHVFDQKNKAHGTFDTKEAANAFAEQKNTEGQTHNYVVFHHNIVDILKKYGLAGLVGAGAAHFKTTPVDNNPFTAQQ